MARSRNLAVRVPYRIARAVLAPRPAPSRPAPPATAARSDGSADAGGITHGISITTAHPVPTELAPGPACALPTPPRRGRFKPDRARGCPPPTRSTRPI